MRHGIENDMIVCIFAEPFNYYMIKEYLLE
jgi:hypothetical protein